MADITVEGNLRSAPELAYTANGHPRLSVAIAEDYGRRNPETGDWQKDGTSWWDVEIWGKAAETIAELDLQRGQRVHVTGTVRIEDYDRRDGGKGRSARIKARRFLPFPTAPDATSAPAPAATPDGWGGGQEPPY